MYYLEYLCQLCNQNFDANVLCCYYINLQRIYICSIVKYVSLNVVVKNSA